MCPSCQHALSPRVKTLCACSLLFNDASCTPSVFSPMGNSNGGCRGGMAAHGAGRSRDACCTLRWCRERLAQYCHRVCITQSSKVQANGDVRRTFGLADVTVPALHAACVCKMRKFRPAHVRARCKKSARNARGCRICPGLHIGATSIFCPPRMVGRQALRGNMSRAWHLSVSGMRLRRGAPRQGGLPVHFWPRSVETLARPAEGRGHRTGP